MKDEEIFERGLAALKWRDEAIDTMRLVIEKQQIMIEDLSNYILKG